jgi:ubiquinone/menaquinone biosynthesis C-methylase UbiE
MAAPGLSPAAGAFDAVADRFDERFGEWRSVAAQRGAVRRALTSTFDPGSRLIEVGGGTGDDALFMAEHGCDVVMTDASPAMVRRAAAKFAGKPSLRAQVVAAEELASFAGTGGESFDGAWSNFAALNCVTDLAPFAAGLARLIRPGGTALLVLFGTCSPGEVLVEALRGRPKAMFRRLARGAVPARLGGESFTVRYHRRRDIERAMAPWFSYAGRQGIGVFVPPSAAEPWISQHPRLLAVLESLDRHVSRPLAFLGDHVLYRFVRHG